MNEYRKLMETLDNIKDNKYMPSGETVIADIRDNLNINIGYMSNKRSAKVWGYEQDINAVYPLFKNTLMYLK